MNNNSFGKILKLLRCDKDISQRTLSEEFGVTNQTISLWETGQREPDFDTLVKIAKYFNVTTDYLLGIED